MVDRLEISGQRRRGSRRIAAVAVALILGAVGACVSAGRRGAQLPESGRADDPTLVRVTGYCNCGKCCSWERDRFGFGSPVYSAGPLKGKRKEVGRTSSGTRAHHGTIAADPKVFPRGTRLFVPGYGEGRVEDTGGAIRGRHIDVWFPSHAEAHLWGSRWLRVENLTANAKGGPGRSRAVSVK